MFENEWHLGRELNALFDSGEMAHGDCKLKKFNLPGEGLASYEDFGINRMHGLLVRRLARDWTAGRVEFKKRMADEYIRASELRPKLNGIPFNAWTVHQMEELAKCETDNDAKRHRQSGPPAYNRVRAPE